MNYRQVRDKKTGKIGVLDHVTKVKDKEIYFVCFDKSNENIKDGSNVNFSLYTADKIEFI